MTKRNKITTRGKHWLKNTTSFRILHHFDQLCNLQNQAGELFTLQTPLIGMGPFSCQIDSDLFRQIETEKSIQIDNHTAKFSINHHDLFTTEIDLWQARPNWNRYRQSPPNFIPHHHQLPKEIQSYFDLLLNSLILDQVDQVAQAAENLAGRGIGLTPTGDDLLMGAIYALHLFPNKQAAIEQIGRAAEGRTTSLSAAFLQAAVAGEAIEAWHHICNGRPGAIEALWQIGHTSGRDAWVGFERTYQYLHGKIT